MSRTTAFTKNQRGLVAPGFKRYTMPPAAEVRSPLFNRNFTTVALQSLLTRIPTSPNVVQLLEEHMEPHMRPDASKPEDYQKVCRDWEHKAIKELNQYCEHGIEFQRTPLGALLLVSKSIPGATSDAPSWDYQQMLIVRTLSENIRACHAEGFFDDGYDPRQKAYVRNVVNHLLTELGHKDLDGVVTADAP